MWSSSPALFPPNCMGVFMGRAKLTLMTLPRISFMSILSMASWASADEPYVTKAKPRCFASASTKSAEASVGVFLAPTRLLVEICYSRRQLYFDYITCRTAINTVEEPQHGRTYQRWKSVRISRFHRHLRRFPLQKRSSLI